MNYHVALIQTDTEAKEPWTSSEIASLLNDKCQNTPIQMVVAFDVNLSQLDALGEICLAFHKANK